MEEIDGNVELVGREEVFVGRMGHMQEAEGELKKKK